MIREEVEWVTFDCYGTLIDWETGIHQVFRELTRRYRLDAEPDRIFELWEPIQFRMIQEPYRTYREILRASLLETLREVGGKDVHEMSDAGDLLAERFPAWKPFPEVPQALRRLKTLYPLGIISNIDNDLIQKTVSQIGVSFDLVVTAEDARAYKPGLAPFQKALERLSVSPRAVLHAAFGFRYDLTPARTAGLQTVFVNRSNHSNHSNQTNRAIPAGYSADAEVADLSELATLLGC